MKNNKMFLKQRRKELGLTLKDIAEKLGVSESLISRYESGDVTNMGIDKIKPYSEILQTNPMSFIDYDFVDINQYIYNIEPFFKKIELSKVKRNELIKEANQYIKEHNLENEPIHYDVPFNENTTDYELLDFLYMINSKNIEIILSKNMEIKEIQKEIIEKTNKINNLEDIKEINAFVDIKYNKVGK